MRAEGPALDPARRSLRRRPGEWYGSAHMKNLWLVALGALCVSMAQASDKNPAEEKAVAAAVAAFNEAGRTGDGEKLKELLSDDLIYSHSSAKTENKQECI